MDKSNEEHFEQIRFYSRDNIDPNIANDTFCILIQKMSDLISTEEICSIEEKIKDLNKFIEKSAKGSYVFDTSAFGNFITSSNFANFSIRMLSEYRSFTFEFADLILSIVHNMPCICDYLSSFEFIKLFIQLNVPDEMKERQMHYILTFDEKNMILASEKRFIVDNIDNILKSYLVSTLFVYNINPLIQLLLKVTKNSSKYIDLYRLILQRIDEYIDETYLRDMNLNTNSTFCTMLIDNLYALSEFSSYLMTSVPNFSDYIVNSSVRILFGIQSRAYYNLPSDQTSIKEAAFEYILTFFGTFYTFKPRKFFLKSKEVKLIEDIFRPYIVSFLHSDDDSLVCSALIFLIGLSNVDDHMEIMLKIVSLSTIQEVIMDGLIATVKRKELCLKFLISLIISESEKFMVDFIANGHKIFVTCIDLYYTNDSFKKTFLDLLSALKKFSIRTNKKLNNLFESCEMHDFLVKNQEDINRFHLEDMESVFE